MTTQSGESYQRKITSSMAEEDRLTLAKVLKVLLEDGQIREKELAKECARREEELREECCCRDDETWGRGEVMRQQMNLLRGLIEGVQTKEETAVLRLEGDRDVGRYCSLCSAP